MHARNKYKKQKPDFLELARHRPSLQPHLIHKGPNYVTINFQDPSALRELTCALLEQDFELKLEIPLDRLIPTIPLRLNYVHWIEDLLSDDGSVPSGCGIHGIDIGTGASCVYPLLCTRLNGWRFTATEIDPLSIECATKNVCINKFDENITIVKVDGDAILDGVVAGDTTYDFCMCNPPFFQDAVDREGRAVNRTGLRPSPPGLSASKMADHEVVTEGGEVEFVGRILMDSLKLRQKIRWYTSMLGKKSSIKELLKQIKHHQVPVVTTTEFVQGRTHRWGIAWSFFESEKHKVNKSNSGNKKEKVYTMHLPEVFTDRKQTKDWITKQFTDLQVEWSVGDEQQSYVCKAVKRTWANQRRKRRLAAEHERSASKRPKHCTAQPEFADCSHENDDITVIPQEVSIESCHLEFVCILNKSDLQFKWLRGDNKDHLHQIIQYLKNQAHLLNRQTMNQATHAHSQTTLK